MQLVDNLPPFLVYNVPLALNPLDFQQVFAAHRISVVDAELVKFYVSKHYTFKILVSLFQFRLRFVFQESFHVNWRVYGFFYFVDWSFQRLKFFSFFAGNCVFTELHLLLIKVLPMDESIGEGGNRWLVNFALYSIFYNLVEPVLVLTKGDISDPAKLLQRNNFRLIRQ